MWNEKLQEIRNTNAIWGEEINDGATDKEIQRFLDEIGDIISVEKLHSYINVLKRVNGIEFNGFILYGIDATMISYLEKLCNNFVAWRCFEVTLKDIRNQN